MKERTMSSYGLLDFTDYDYTIKTIMIRDTGHYIGDFYFMCNMLYCTDISLGEYLNDSFFNRNKPRTLRRVVTNSKSIRSVCISNKKDIHNSSCSLHKLSDFK